jgi:hypothetical protein
MTNSEIINLSAIFLGPVFAVMVTLWWQARKQKRDEKLRLFLSLMAHRRSIPPAPEWVNSLNVIDVIFADVPQVVQLWHEYYTGLCSPPQNNNHQQREHTYLLMLSAMARHLGYQKLEQTDIRSIQQGSMDTQPQNMTADSTASRRESPRRSRNEFQKPTRHNDESSPTVSRFRVESVVARRFPPRRYFPPLSDSDARGLTPQSETTANKARQGNPRPLRCRLCFPCQSFRLGCLRLGVRPILSRLRPPDVHAHGKTEPD